MMADDKENATQERARDKTPQELTLSELFPPAKSNFLKFPEPPK
jgi:hypothetical protein